MRIRHRADYDQLYPDLNRELILVLRSVEWLIGEIARVSKSDLPSR